MEGGAGVNQAGEDPRQERNFMHCGNEQRTTEDSEDAEESAAADQPGRTEISAGVILSEAPGFGVERRACPEQSEGTPSRNPSPQHSQRILSRPWTLHSYRAGALNNASARRSAGLTMRNCPHRNGGVPALRPPAMPFKGFGVKSS